MKRVFIIPTWEGHFSKNITFLKSCIKFNINTPVKIVVSNEDEKLNLESLISEIPLYEKLDLEIVDIETIISKFKPEIKLSDIEELKLIHQRVPTIFNSKHPYQAIKKLYALRYFDYDNALLLDSESAFVKETNMDELFDEYFSNPQIFYTPHDKINPNLMMFTNASQKCLRWTDVGDVKNMWVFDNMYWMVDKSIFDDMLNDIESNLGVDIYTEFVNNPNEIFEMITYYSYIHINNEKYGYRFVNYYDTIKDYLKEFFDDYINEKSNRVGGAMEFMFSAVGEKNFDAIFKFINDYKVRFCRPDYCDTDYYKRATQQSPYLNMIVASENSESLLNFLNH